jgi:hypothetical protein
MASTSSFKQQCPSCEAMVPIRDPGLVGKKIDCPKCKYRFLVEEPAPEEDPDDLDSAAAAEEERSTAVTTKKGKSKKKLRDDTVGPDENDEEAKSKPPNTKVLYIGIGFGVIAVVALIGGGILLFGGGGSSKSGGGGGGGGSSVAKGNPAPTPQPPVVPQPAAPVEQAAPAEADAGGVDEIENILPNETVILASLDTERLLNSSAKTSLTDVPGSFSLKSFERTFEFPLENAKRFLTAVVLGEKPGQAAFFSVMRTEKPYSREHLTKSLKLTPLPAINGLASFAVNGDLDSLSAFFLRFSTPPTDKISVHFIDSQTIVFADAAPMKKFLEDKRHPQPMTAPPAPSPDRGSQQVIPESTRRPTSPGQPGGAQTTTPIRAGRPRSDDGSSGARISLFQQPGAPPAGTPPAGTPPPPGATAPPGTPPGVAPPAGTPAPGSPAPATGIEKMVGGGARGQLVEAEPTASGLYLTIDPSLKIAMDRLEREKEKSPDKSPYIFYAALSIKQPKLLPEEVASSDAVDKELIRKLLPRLPMPEGARVLAVGLREFTEIKAAGTLILQTETDDAARQAKALIDIGTDHAANLFRTNWTMEVKPSDGTGARPMPRSTKGISEVVAPPPLPPVGGNSGKDGAMTTLVRDKTVVFTIDVNLKHELYEQIRDALSAEMVQMKGLAELVGSRPRVHELARALQAYVKAKGAYPRGAQLRPPSSDRGIDWYPDQRLSWMVELLPFLGDGEFKDLVFDTEKSWNEGNNLLTAQVLVPQFLSPGEPGRARIHYPGKIGLFAATRFVGVAGVGLDAASYPAGNAAVAKKAGVFGYDRVTKPDDIRDEAENTIALLQVPAGQISPWMAGGGSTLRGISEGDNPVKPFVCVEYKGKKGTYAVMADGKVRFIAADMKPAVFRSLCTIAGGERMDDINDTAPVVPEEDFLQETKAAAVVASAPGQKAETAAPAASATEPPVTASPPAGAAAVPTTPPPAGSTVPPAVPPGSAPPAAVPSAPGTGSKLDLPAGWKETVDEESGYAIALPPGPQTPLSLPTVPGAARQKAFVVAGKNDTAYTVTYFKLPIAVPPTEYSKIFESIRDQTAKDSKVTGEKPLQLEGGAGVEWVLENQKVGRIATRCFIVKDQVYALSAAGSKADAKEVEAFFNSFRVLKK